jgi:tyrosyl-tRNA synthetase
MSSPSGLDLLLRGATEVIALKELTDKLQKKGKLRVKLGVDPTAPDIHLGHTVVLGKLRDFQEQGHTIIFIIGDFTTRIGDPTGQSATRPKLDPEQIRKNAQTYQDQVFKVLDKSKTEVRFNSEWLSPLGAEGILELGFHYTMQRIMERDDFSKRLKEERPIALTESFYPLLQGYDSVAIQSDVELGGTDQKFNLLVGRELQRDYGQEPQVVMTMPLLVGTDGSKKMSKSYGNYVALNDAPQEMFGKIMSVSDPLMWQYYELLTREDLNAAKALHPMEAKKRLASLIVGQYHGEAEGRRAREEFEKVFTKKDTPDDIEEYRAAPGKISISHLLFEAGLSPSKKESRRLIEQGGVRIDGQQVQSDADVQTGQPFILQVGKRKFKRIVFQ